MNGFEKIKSLGLFFGISLILFGSIFLIFPDNVINFLAFLVGFAIIGFGVFRSAVLFMQWMEISNRIIKLIVSVAMIFLGLFIISNTEITVAALGVLAGTFAILLAFDRFNVAVMRKRAGLKNTSTIVFGLIHLAFGLGMFYSAFSIISFIISIIGIYLLFAGAMVIMSTSYFFDF